VRQPGTEAQRAERLCPPIALTFYREAKLAGDAMPKQPAKKVTKVKTQNRTTDSKVKTPSQKIDEYIAELDDWRHAVFLEIRRVIQEADPEVIEEWKWMGTPVWYHDGIVACANAHKGKVKLTFNQGANLSDPNKLFNAGLEGNQRRAIDVFEEDKIKKGALKALILAAISYNRAALKKSATKSKSGGSNSRKK
jgi:hypothetical protein